MTPRKWILLNNIIRSLWFTAFWCVVTAILVTVVIYGIAFRHGSDVTYERIVSLYDR